MPTDQEETVATGLEALAPSVQKSTTVTVPDAPADDAPSADVPLAIKGLSDDVVTKVEEVNQPAVQAFSIDEQRKAENDNMKRDFMEKLSAAKRPEDTPYVPPAVPVRIAEQTRLEQEAGARRVQEFAEIEAQRPKRVQPSDGSMTPVFRPADYVPDPKKGQGNAASNSARTL